MKKIIIALAVCLCGQTLLSQNLDSTVTLNLDQAKLSEALPKLEELTGFKFYYDESWLDSIHVSIQAESQPLQVVLDQMLNGTQISHFIQDSDVILSKNTVIISEPKILQTGKSSERNSKNTEMGLVFVQEYQNVDVDESDVENYVYDIGSRTEMVIGSQATIAGYVRNAENNEPIIGTLVYIKEPFQATTTDANGFYSISLPTGKHTLLFQYAGMKTTQRNIVLFSNGSLHVDMLVDVIALQEVVIESGRDANIKDIKVGVSKVNIEESKTVPMALGEKDVMRVATTMAGVQTVGEGAAGYNVRGGKADQNLILVGGAPVYNPNHFFGFFSAFNADAIEDMEVYKGSIPAEYGGRLSSIFDLGSKTANKQKFSGSGGISPVTSRLTLEIPVIKDTTSILIGGRATYSNWALKYVDNANFRENKVDFHDVITKIDHVINDKNKIVATGYFSRDFFRLNSDTLFSFSDFSYINLNGSLNWQKRFSHALDANFSLIYAQYGYEVSYTESPPNAFVQDFGIRETSANASFNYYPNEQQQINFGASTKYYHVNPGSMIPKGPESTVLSDIVQEERGLESALYISDQYEINPSLTVYGGLRYSIFNALGPQDVYNYAAGVPKSIESRTDTMAYSGGNIIATHHGPELRIYGRYTLGDASAVKLSYNRTRQYIHTLSNSAAISPTDTWRLSSKHLMPQIADQVSLGYYRNFFNNQLETSVEGYYKHLQNLVDFKVGASFLLHPAAETQILQGDGKSYGLEFSIKKTGRLNGWINYTYARTLIKLDGNFLEERINDGQFFPTNYDKPHTLNMVANYKITRRFSASTNVAFSSGRPVTYPVALYDFQGSQNIHYSDRNAYRIPDYFRVDLGLNLEGNHKIQKLSHSFWTLSIYNLLGRNNPYSVFFDIDNGEISGYKLIIFGEPIPTITYNFKF